MSVKEKKPMSKKKKIVLTIVGIFLFLLIIALIAGVIFYNRMLNNLNRFENVPGVVATNPPDATMPSGSDSEATLNPYDFEVMFPGEEPLGGEIINIMLVGQDTRNPEQRGLSDTMILISVNPANNKMVITSFLRDTYLDIVCIGGVGTYKDRLNTAYCTGGIDQLADTLAYNFGVEIDNFIEVDFEAFSTIVDALGGIDIELTEAEYMHMKHELLLDVQEGMNHLDGEKALEYARIRKIDSDFYRTERQRTVINEIFKKVKSSGIAEILELTEQFLPLVTTDMSNTDITKYIIQLTPLLKNLQVETLRIPVDGSWAGRNVGTESAPKYVIECINNKMNRDVLKKTIGSNQE